MPFMRVATIVVYSGAYLFLVFFAVCLATGLYYLAELVEEYTRLTRKVITYTIRAVLVLHALLLLIDRLPFYCVLIGVASHVLYHRLLKTFPYISLTSPDFIGSVVLLLLSHVVWIRFFFRDPRCAYVSMEWLLGFMLIMVWIVPFSFFISLSANESVLPGVGSGYQPFGNGGLSHGADASGVQRRTQRKECNSLLGFLNFLRKKRDEVLPRVTQGIPYSTHRDS